MTKILWSFHEIFDYIGDDGGGDDDDEVLDDLFQEPLNSYLDGAAIQKIWKHRFLGNFSNSRSWVTWMGLTTTQKIFFWKNLKKRGC